MVETARTPTLKDRPFADRVHAFMQHIANIHGLTLQQQHMFAQLGEMITAIHQTSDSQTREELQRTRAEFTTGLSLSINPRIHEVLTLVDRIEGECFSSETSNHRKVVIHRPPPSSETDEDLQKAYSERWADYEMFE